jgi:hypothetical protein
MFGSLIRRKPARSFEQDDAAFESTTFSLSTAVPRPTERRDEDRVLPTLCIVKVTAKDNEQLVRVRNLSAGGLMAEIGQQVTVGDKVEIEFNSQKIPSSGRATARPGSSSRTISTSASFSPAASPATAFARDRRGWRSSARRICASARPIIIATSTTFRSPA